MNKIRKNMKIYLIGILALLFASCSDFLDKNPLDQISSETFWQNEKEANMALAGVYSRGIRQFTFGHNGRDCSFDVMAGEVYGTQVNLAQGEIEPTSGGLVSTIFDDCYEGISACNFFLANVDKTPIDATILNKYKGEVRFLRALFYFELVQHYGGVPLYTTPVTIDEAIVKQSPKATVMDQIMTDLDFAIANLPNDAYTDGHAVKGSALALKARVALFDSDWGTAATAANQVIQDGKFRLYLDSDDSENNAFRNLFLQKGQDNNPEIIFSGRYQEPDVYHDLDIRWNWHGVVNPRQELVDAYECIDGLPIDESPLYNPDNWKENRDPRLLKTIKAFADSVYNSAGQKIGFAYNNITNIPYNPVKYGNWDELPIDYSTRSDQDWILIRYADVLLMYAEAKNETSGPDASVYTAVNQVRDRAGMPALPEGLSKEQMREKIRHERRVEFALEGIRWMDILRWGIAEDVINGLVDPGGRVRVFDPTKHYLLPFPQDEMDVNTELDQNPGY